MDDVADDAIIPNYGRILRRGVDDRIVLNTRARTNLDVAVVAAKYCTWPNGRFGSNFN